MPDEESDGEQTPLVDYEAETRSDPELLGDGGIQTDDDGQEKLERVLRALLDQRRRYTLYVLQETEVTDLDKLAAQVVALEQDAAPEAVDLDRVVGTPYLSTSPGGKKSMQPDRDMC